MENGELEKVTSRIMGLFEEQALGGKMFKALRDDGFNSDSENTSFLDPLIECFFIIQEAKNREWQDFTRDEEYAAKQAIATAAAMMVNLELNNKLISDDTRKIIYQTRHNIYDISEMGPPSPSDPGAF